MSGSGRIPIQTRWRNYALQTLYEHFPFGAATRVDVLVFHGEAGWHDPRLGPGPGAGSRATEVPHLVPRRDWWRSATLGFEKGLFLVAVAQDQPCYRADEALVERVWTEAARRPGLHADRAWSNEEQRHAVEQEAFRQLMAVLEARA